MKVSFIKIITEDEEIFGTLKPVNTACTVSNKDISNNTYNI